MPRISDAQKLVVEQQLDQGLPYTVIQRSTGPAGFFPLAPAPISQGSIVNLRRRIGEHGDVLYRQIRVTAKSLTSMQQDTLHELLRSNNTRFTWELCDGLQRAGLGLAMCFPHSTIDDNLREYLGHTFKRATREAPNIDRWQVACLHNIIAGIPTVRSVYL